MAEGSHSKYKGTAMQAVWTYKGKVIVVTYSKQGALVLEARRAAAARLASSLRETWALDGPDAELDERALSLA